MQLIGYHLFANLQAKPPTLQTADRVGRCKIVIGQRVPLVPLYFISKPPVGGGTRDMPKAFVPFVPAYSASASGHFSICPGMSRLSRSTTIAIWMPASLTK